MNTESDSLLKVLVIEDVELMRQTIVDAFERPEIQVRFPSGGNKRFKCTPAESLSVLCEEKVIEQMRFDLAIVDLNLAADTLAGLLATRQLRAGQPDLRIAVFTGIDRTSPQEWVDLVLKLSSAGIWDFTIKGLPTELVRRIVNRWEKELDEKHRREQAEVVSRQIRAEPARQAEWKNSYVAFYIDAMGSLRPDPGKFPGDEYLVDQSYLNLLLRLTRLRKDRPQDVPEQPFIVKLTGRSLLG